MATWSWGRRPRTTALRRVRRFVEKPDAAKAAQFAASGNHLWNAGIFLFRGSTLLDILARLQPELARGLEEIAADPDRVQEIYPRLPAELGRLRASWRSSTTSPPCRSTAAGATSAPGRRSTRCSPATSRATPAAATASPSTPPTTSCSPTQGTIAVLGVSGLVVVRTGDTVLVLPKERAQDVKRLVNELAARRREDLL